MCRVVQFSPSDQRPTSGGSGGGIWPCPSRSVSGTWDLSFARADGHWAVYGTYQANSTCKSTKSAAVIRFVFNSLGGQKCVGGRGSATDPSGQLTALAYFLAGLRGRRDKRKGGGEQGGVRGRVRSLRLQLLDAPLRPTDHLKLGSGRGERRLLGKEEQTDGKRDFGEGPKTVDVRTLGQAAANPLRRLSCGTSGTNEDGPPSPANAVRQRPPRSAR